MQARNRFGLLPLLISLLALSGLSLVLACSINVKKDESGRDKKVDIETPIGGIHVSKGADVHDTGLPVYPGARQKQEDNDGSEKSANVNISSGMFGLKVVALEYQSDDSPQKLVAYYKNQLKKYGNVLECHTNGHGGNVRMEHGGGSSKDIKCDGDDNGNTIELKVGTEDNQHIVAIEPRGKAADFALVYVKTRGKDTI